MKRYFLILLLAGIFSLLNGQRFMTKTGYISFFSHTPLEDIKGENNQVASIFDASTGDLVFHVLIRSFKFEKALMEEHFNENYLESDKYPRATFSGKILNLKEIDLTKPGKYPVKTEGDLTIHNVTRKISADGVIEVGGGKLSATSRFNVSPEDYNISIPRLVRENIAKIIEVTVQMQYDQSGGN